MRFDIISVTPQAFQSYFDTSILKRARERQLIDIRVHNLRDWAKGSYRQVDNKPYGGGAGMVLMAEPILKAVTEIQSKVKGQKPKVILLSAKGKQFNQKMAYDWAKHAKQIIFISGRYEGIDERVKQVLKAEEISVGPYVLTDGDVAAMTMVSAVARLTPGVIRLESLQEESHWNLLVKKEATGGKKGREYPHYTRPEVLIWKGKKIRVPRVLLSGDHTVIRAWREARRR